MRIIKSNFFTFFCLCQVLKVTMGILERLESQVTLGLWAGLDLLARQG